MRLVIPYFLPHEGCPHQCLFCNQNKITGTKEVAERTNDVQQDIDRTIKQWLNYRSRHKEVQFAFYGGSFTCLPLNRQNGLLNAVQPYLASGEIDTIRLSTRPDCIDSSISDNLVNNGVGIVELGVQSLDDRVLFASMRGHTADDCACAVDDLRAAGITIGIQLMPGLPHESSYSFIRTVRKTIDLAPEFVRIYPSLVVQNSGLAEVFAKGEYVPLSLKKAVVMVGWARNKFISSRIRVVRMGLQSSPSLEQSIVAGPYHPAFGEMVISRDWLKRVKRLLAAHPKRKVKVTISERDLSSFNGMQKANIVRLEELGLLNRLEVTMDKHLKRGMMFHVVS